MATKKHDLEVLSYFLLTKNNFPQWRVVAKITRIPSIKHKFDYASRSVGISGAAGEEMLLGVSVKIDHLH